MHFQIDFENILKRKLQTYLARGVAKLVDGCGDDVDGRGDDSGRGDSSLPECGGGDKQVSFGMVKLGNLFAVFRGDFLGLFLLGAGSSSSFSSSSSEERNLLLGLKYTAQLLEILVQMMAS